MNTLRTPRPWLRAGAVIGAVLAVVLGLSGVAAASAPPTGFVVHAGDLVMTSVDGHYTGTLPVSVRNASSEPATSTWLKVTLPDGMRFLGAGTVCLVVTGGWGCDLGTFAPGERRTVYVSLGSTAGPEPFARITAAGTVAALQGESAPGAQATDRYAAVLRSIYGSVRHPRPYTPSTVYDLALAANGSPVVTRDASALTIRLPLVARNRTDANNSGAYVGLTVNGETVISGIDPTAPCTSVCPISFGSWLAKGEVRYFAMVLRLPPETAAGTYQIQAYSSLSLDFAPPIVDQTPQDNLVDYTVVVPAL